MIHQALQAHDGNLVMDVTFLTEIHKKKNGYKTTIIYYRWTLLIRWIIYIRVIFIKKIVNELLWIIVIDGEGFVCLAQKVWQMAKKMANNMKLGGLH